MNKGLLLEAFFTVKTHKPEYPFLTIVSEKGSWPHLVSGYLQEHLESLRLLDPYLVCNSTDVVDYLQTDGVMVSDAFSVDVVDLYYSIPHAPLLQSVKECIIDDNDEVAFRNACGVSVEGFIKLLALYIRSTLVAWGGKVYVQKAGICIGSRVAPVLCNIFLSKVDRTIAHELDGRSVKVFRFVDGYLVLVGDTAVTHTLVDVMKTFKKKKAWP